MESLVKQLQAAGLSPLQIEKSLLITKGWLDERYPILGRIYHTEMLQPAQKELKEIGQDTDFRKAS